MYFSVVTICDPASGSGVFSVGNEAGKMGVLLFDTSGKRDVCINAFLVQHGYAEDTGDGQISRLV